MTISRTALSAAALASACLVIAACGRPSEEARIRRLLKDAAALAEKRDVDGLMEYFSPEYADFEGRDKAETAGLVSGYLDRYRGVVVHLLGSRFETLGPDGRATVECEFSLSHGAAEVLRKLIRYAGEYYRFRISLGKNERGEWRFTSAEWRSITLAELFPESLDVLRKLFPDL